MAPRRTASSQEQARVNAHFDSKSLRWHQVYADRTLNARIYQQRSSVSLEWIDELPLSRGSSILEIGCGAGWSTVGLAQRGFLVHGVDSSEAMIELTRKNAAESGVAERVTTRVADAHSLDYEDGNFHLVIGLGVLSWLHSPERALCEMTRVIVPGGFLLVTAWNPVSLVHLLEPRRNFLLRPLRAALRQVRDSARPRANKTSIAPKMYSASQVDSFLSRAGLEKVKSGTFGFGPITFLGRNLLPEALGVLLHRSLQAGADRGTPILRRAGRFYIVLARKPDAGEV
jgi:ubiquinone/menaquinone biosynthesis C-methylase UbiE